jgi:hypothetical protein
MCYNAAVSDMETLLPVSVEQLDLYVATIDDAKCPITLERNERYYLGWFAFYLSRLYRCPGIIIIQL